KAEVLALDIAFDSLSDTQGILAELEEGDTRIDLVKG
ncbi:MAG: hypothetical protein ACI857_001187, partial [Arenicella sp.]